MSGNSAFVFRKAWVAAAFAWAIACICNLCFVPALSAQVWNDSIVAKRVRIRIPEDRQWLGRETISDLERCWEFVDAATGGKLPNRVLVVIHWQDAITNIDVERGTVSIGMNDPASAANAKAFLLHSAVRELSRMALISLSGGGAAKEENRFLLEGMSEMLAHDYASTVRRLGAVWAVSYYLDRMNPFGLKQMSSRPELAGKAHDLRSAAPGVTFLTLCRDLFGRDRTLKLFELLARKSLEESLTATFRTPMAALEARWLERVRKYNPEDVTIAAEEEAPALDRITFVPDPGKPGTPVAMRLFTRDGANDLYATGIFVVDETGGRVLQGCAQGTTGSRYTQIDIPIDAARQDGRYRVRVVVVDEGGNIRNWEAFYSVAR
jgi:hypothetical protein